MFRTLVVIIAWIALLFIVYATLSPLDLRPHFANVSIERFGAFAVAGLLFGLAYPRHVWLVLVVVVGSAIGLEVLQRMTPDRHGEFRDAAVKFAGGVVGIGLSAAVNRAFRRNSL
jgi:VanZ family protein